MAALKTIVGLEYSHLWHAAVADNLHRLGRTSEAAGELHTAMTLAPSKAEQRLLRDRLNAVLELDLVAMCSLCADHVEIERLIAFALLRVVRDPAGEEAAGLG